MVSNSPQSTPFGSYAGPLQELGYSVIPVQRRGKRPIQSDWQNAWQRQDEVLADAQKNAKCSVGILTRGLAAIDLDILDGPAMKHMKSHVMKTLGFNSAPVRVGNRPKALVLARRAEGPQPKMSGAYWRDPQGTAHRVEILGDGQQFVAYGTHQDTGKPYLWLRGDPVGAEIAQGSLPTINTEQLLSILEAFDDYADAQGWERVSNSSTGAPGGDIPLPVNGLTLSDTQAALQAYPNRDLHYDEWLGVGMALHQQFGGIAEAFEVWDTWSQSSGKYGGEAYGWKRWLSFDDSRPGGITMRSVLMRCQENGWVRPAHVEGPPDPVSSDDFPELDTATLDPVDVPDLPTDAPQDEFPLLDEPETPSEPVSKREGIWTPELDFTPDSLPVRRWLMEGLLMRGHVTGLAGPPGVAKSTFELIRAVSMATGRPLLGETLIESGPVLLVNNEDDLLEIKRRLAAVQIAYGVKNEDIHGRLFFWSGHGDTIRFAEKRDRRESLKRTAGVEKLIGFLKSKGIKALFVDPLISTALGVEENDNNDMDALVSIWKGIAREADVAVSLTHHTRKSGKDSESHAGDANAFRGGGAFIGAVRLAHTLAAMAAGTAKALCIDPAEARRLVRADNAKSNYSLPDGAAQWYRLDSITLPNGESVGAPRAIDLADVPRTVTSDDIGPGHKDLQRKRMLLVQSYLQRIGQNKGKLTVSLHACADLWMGEEEITQNTALDRVRNMVPEGKSGAAVVLLNDEYYTLWRETFGEGRGRRTNVFFAIDDSAGNDWLD